jgi:exodeoxyribonuclease VII small subunit
MGNKGEIIPNSEFRIPNSKTTFEQAATRIDEIVRLLERGDAPLDQSLALFEEGANLIKTAGKMLDDAEQKVVRLQKGADGEPKESLFDDE